MAGCHIEAPDRTFLWCPSQSARRLKEVMDERVRVDEGVRLARPRVQRLSEEMEREATALLAGLLRHAAREDGGGALRSVSPGVFDGATLPGERPGNPDQDRGSGR